VVSDDPPRSRRRDCQTRPGPGLGQTREAWRPRAGSSPCATVLRVRWMPAVPGAAAWVRGWGTAATGAERQLERIGHSGLLGPGRMPSGATTGANFGMRGRLMISREMLAPAAAPVVLTSTSSVEVTRPIAATYCVSSIPHDVANAAIVTRRVLRHHAHRAGNSMPRGSSRLTLA